MNKAGSGASHSPTFSAVVSSVARITLAGPIATVGIGWASRGALGGEGEGRSGEGRGEERRKKYSRERVNHLVVCSQCGWCSS